VEEDILKVAVSYNLEEDDTERVMFKFERQQEWVEGLKA
jgi:hypothetical protein